MEKTHRSQHQRRPFLAGAFPQLYKSGLANLQVPSRAVPQIRKGFSESSSTVNLRKGKFCHSKRVELPTPFRFQDFLSPTTENIQKKNTESKYVGDSCHINLASPRLPPVVEEKHHLGGWASRWPGPPCELPNVPMNSWENPVVLKGCPTWLSNHPHQNPAKLFRFSCIEIVFLTKKNRIETIHLLEGKKVSPYF